MTTGVRDRRAQSLPAPERREVRVGIGVANNILSEGLVALMRLTPPFKVVARADSLALLVDTVGTKQPDLVIVDLASPDSPMTDILASFVRVSPAVVVIGLAHEQATAAAHVALRSGVSRVLSPASSAQELFDALRLATPALSLEPSRLSSREMSVLGELAAGRSNREIASNLFIVEGTVKRHLVSIYRKLGAQSRLDAVRRAEALGLIR